MRLLLKTACGLTIAMAAGFGFVMIRYPVAEPASSIRIELTEARLARGRYLVEHVVYCLDCHSDRDWDHVSGPVVEGTEGRGARLDFLGSDRHSANITPHGIGDWTDGEVVRAITAGVNKRGEALHPLMPYDTYAHLSEEDALAIVAFLRALPAIPHDPPAASDPLPMRLLARTLPSPWTPSRPPDRADTVAYGKYLITIAECDFCHRSNLAGGASFDVPGRRPVRSANITPGAGSRMAGVTREGFIGLFKSFGSPETRRAVVPPARQNTVMPWVRFSGMTEEDLGAIYDYLRTIPPVDEPPRAAGSSWL